MTTGGLDTQPSATTYDLEDLIAQAWSGGVRVPHFQRDFRWATQDVIRLFDSIVRGYPIGSLLLWVRQSPKERITLGRLEIDAPASESSLWVVDGQQRITSLANALHPDGNRHSPFDICYDLVDREFKRVPNSAESHHVRLPILFDLEKLLDWFSGPGQEATEHFGEARRIAKALRQYRVPVYLVKQDNEQVLTDIFDRMNNFGKRLSRAEVFSALFAGPEEGAGNRLSIGRIAERVAATTGFGTIDDDTVLASVLARRGPDPSREIRSEFGGGRRTEAEFPGEDRDVAYAEGEHALIRAVEFLQSDVGVPHLALLPYRSLLVVMTRFFAHFPTPAPRSRQLLRRVFWRVAVSGPAVFRGSFTQVSRVLSARIHPGDERGSIEGLIDTMADAPRALPNPDRFRTNEAGSKIILGSWWALRPRSPFTGDLYDQADLSTVLADQTTAAITLLRFFPNDLPVRQRLWSANRYFVPHANDPTDEFATALSHRPAHLDESKWDAVLASHCMDRQTATFLANDNREQFLAARQAIVAKRLAEFIDRKAEWTFEDTPALDTLDLDDLDELEDRNDGDR